MLSVSAALSFTGNWAATAVNRPPPVAISIKKNLLCSSNRADRTTPSISTNWLSSRPLISSSKETGLRHGELAFPKDPDAAGLHHRRKLALPRQPFESPPTDPSPGSSSPPRSAGRSRCRPFRPARTGRLPWEFARRRTSPSHAAARGSGARPPPGLAGESAPQCAAPAEGHSGLTPRSLRRRTGDQPGKVSACVSVMRASRASITLCGSECNATEYSRQEASWDHVLAGSRAYNPGLLPHASPGHPGETTALDGDIRCVSQVDPINMGDTPW